MSSYERAGELVGKLRAAGLAATLDPRGATPPCVLVPPPARTYDLACGYTARWQLVALVPGLANADAHKALDELTDTVAGVFDIVTVTEIQPYSLSPDNPPFPAWRIELVEALTWP